MGIFDQLKDFAEDNIPGAAGGLGALGAVQGAIFPQEMVNLQDQAKNLQEQISNFIQQIQAQTIQPGELVHIRTGLHSLFMHLIEGGEPVPSPAKVAMIKAMPQYAEVKSKYSELEAQLIDLERQYLHCTYGFQMPDGQIITPDPNWSKEQWDQARDQSMHQTARCWLDSDRTQYV